MVRRFVEQQQVGFRNDGAREHQPVLLSAREVCRPANRTHAPSMPSSPSSASARQRSSWCSAKPFEHRVHHAATRCRFRQELLDAAHLQAALVDDLAHAGAPLSWLRARQARPQGSRCRRRADAARRSAFPPRRRSRRSGRKVALPDTTSSSRISQTAVVPGSTSAGAAPRSSSNSCSPAALGPPTCRRPPAGSARLRPLMISARVAGVPMPFASFSRSRRASSFTKRQAFCMASTSVPSL